MDQQSGEHGTGTGSPLGAVNRTQDDHDEEPDPDGGDDAGLRALDDEGLFPRRGGSETHLGEGDEEDDHREEGPEGEVAGSEG